jgi:hypothetical protein
MPARRKPIGLLILVVILGVIIGSSLAEVIAYVLPGESVVEKFLTKSITPGFAPTGLDIGALILTIGIKVKVNVMGILGIVLASYLYRWY